MIEVKGHNGQIAFDGQYVTITRKGFLARTTVGKGEKRIHISQISSVQWKPAGPFVNGFIAFSAAGGNERRSKFGSQTYTAVNDENSVLFTTRQKTAFEELRKAVESAIATQHVPAAPPMPFAPPPASVADELTKLAALRDQGALTEDEFQQQKQRLLGG
ncbi:DUF4429 domain-containing protein [Streptomyces lancefieldiae]|uniref:DUF4429 domain-containing protein n=1 Tax=Streptomyces lancefieldiae TaxID=3075520 RepID=A0ABU3AF75_9ACTN|nr:DUF4429 domain-containing protein [Streptomyces sp. DSM 40712]MDT0608826.1 DUF4429 domain-containing protein [Streptomyces sp. DSM 40712]